MKNKDKRYLYTNIGTDFLSHESHGIQPSSIVFKVRTQGPGWGMYGAIDPNLSVKRILLSDSQVILLNDIFDCLCSPTEEQISLFRMLHGIDISDLLKDMRIFL